jgi:hypothetical protein
MSEKQVGFVFFAQELKEVPLARVAQALSASRLSEKVLRELHPRHLFARATKELVRKGLFKEEEGQGILRDKAPETSAQSIYQVSLRRVTDDGIKYDKKAYVVLDKIALTITADPLSLQGEIESAYAKVSGVYTPGDFRGLIHRIVRTRFREIYLRDGVYFLPPEAADLLDEIKKFFEGLGFSLYVLPVGVSEVGIKKSILEAVISDVRKNVENLRAELEKTEDVSSVVARNRLETVRTDLAKYRDVAKGLGTTLARILEDAGDAGKVLRQVGSNSLESLILAVTTGKEVDPLLVKIVGSRGEDDFRFAPAEDDEKIRIELAEGEPREKLLFYELEPSCSIRVGPG